jgi:cyclophilin family peptidyl-prolyl cis-trans isomerase
MNMWINIAFVIALVGASFNADINVNKYSTSDNYRCEANPVVTNVSFSDQVDLLYPVWTATSARDAETLIEFLQSEVALVREATWRGLSNMTLVTPEVLFEFAMNDTLAIRWYTLSNHPVKAEHLRVLEELVGESSNADKEGIFLVLGKQGDATSLNKLLQWAGEDFSPTVSAPLGLAVNRAYLRFPQTLFDQSILVKNAISSTDAMAQTSWLYAWYRSSQVMPSATSVGQIASWTQAYFGEAYGLLRQYFIAILGRAGHSSLPAIIQSEGISTLSPLEGVELARVMNRYVENASFNAMMQELLNNGNPYVRIEASNALRSLESKLDDGFMAQLLSRIETATPFEALGHVSTLHKWWPETGRQAFVNLPDYAEMHVQLLNEYLELAKLVESKDELLARLTNLVESGTMRKAAFAVGQASSLVMASPDDAELKSKVLSILNKAAEVNSDQIALALHQSNSAMNWTSGEVSQPLFDMISKGKAISEFQREKYTPTPEAIKSIGAHPVWVLHTELGDIVMRLETMKAPWTVTRFKDYADLGWYQGTPFHRVVHNFVVQSGAVWREDVPNSAVQLIPTEASERDFSRGAVGIASAGRDTETTQFFMMHMWAPHLNGSYTNFGMVTEGMDIIDRLPQGTMVTGSSFHSCE